MPQTPKQAVLYRPSSFIYILSSVLLCILVFVHFTDAEKNKKNVTNNQLRDYLTKELNKTELISKQKSIPAKKLEQKTELLDNKEKNFIEPLTKNITSGTLLKLGNTESLKWGDATLNILYNKRDLDGKRLFTITIKTNQHTIEKKIYSYENISSINIADLNANSKPEFYLTWLSDGSGAYGAIEGYELDTRGGNSLTKMHFHPQPQGKGYMGYDQFRIYQDHIEHSYPLYKEGDTNNQSTGGTAYIRYRFNHNEHIAKLKVLE